MAQIGLADNYIRRMSITSSLAAAAQGADGVWPEGDLGDGRAPVVYKNTRMGRLSKRFAQSRLGRFFDIEHRRTTLTAEMRAGLVGFLTVSCCWGFFRGRALLPDRQARPPTRALSAQTPKKAQICYIVAVNPAILGETGGPCSPADCTGPTKGTPACKFDGDPGYEQCLISVKRSLVATTCICAAIGCFMMAFLGK
jgi:hypothetical protein